jgi:hypothetical protein
MGGHVFVEYCRFGAIRPMKTASYLARVKLSKMVGRTVWRSVSASAWGIHFYVRRGRPGMGWEWLAQIIAAPPHPCQLKKLREV